MIIQHKMNTIIDAVLVEGMMIAGKCSQSLKVFLEKFESTSVEIMTSRSSSDCVKVALRV